MEKRRVRLSKASISELEHTRVGHVLTKEYLGMGEETGLFEADLKSYLKTPMDVISVNTGTSALHLAVEALDLPKGSEVIVPSITFVGSFQAVSAAGMIPVACDIDLNTGFIDLADAEKRITKQTKAIMPVHYTGACDAIDELYAFADAHSLRVIEDAAHSFGTTHKGRNIGTFGDVICFSFDGIKNITCGEGGAILTSDQKVAELARDGRLLSIIKDTDKRLAGKRSWIPNVERQGFRYHMSNLNAAIGRMQLQRFAEFKKVRQQRGKDYQKALAGIPGIEIFRFDYDTVTPHIFVIKVKNDMRDKMTDYLTDLGVETGRHYYPNHLLKKYKTDYALKNSEQFWREMMTLPMHSDLTSDDVHYVAEAIRKFF